MQKEHDLAIIITGPKIDLSLEPVTEFFNDKIQNIVMIGDGVNDINSSTNTTLFNALNNFNSTYSTAIDGRVLVFLNMHGTVSDDKHVVQANNDGALLATSALFTFLNQSINKPFDIIFTACHGKAALPDISKLPDGSRIIIFSEEDTSTYANNYIYSFNAMSNMTNFTFEKFYNNYLAHLTLKENPIMATVGGKIIDPLLIVNSQIGKSISFESRLYMHENFGKNICEEDSQCHGKLEALMNKMENSSSIDEFYQANSYFSEEFKQEILALENKIDILEREEDDDDIYSTDFEKIFQVKAEDLNCPAWLILLKNEVDQFFVKFNIPATLNLESKTLLDDDDDDDDDDDNSGILDSFIKYQDFSDRALYDILKLVKYDIGSDLFILNDNFVAPEYPEYGTVLGISYDLSACYLLD